MFSEYNRNSHLKMFLEIGFFKKSVKSLKNSLKKYGFGYSCREPTNLLQMKSLIIVDTPGKKKTAKVHLSVTACDENIITVLLRDVFDLS